MFRGVFRGSSAAEKLVLRFQYALLNPYCIERGIRGRNQDLADEKKMQLHCCLTISMIFTVGAQKIKILPRLPSMGFQKVTCENPDTPASPLQRASQSHHAVTLRIQIPPRLPAEGASESQQAVTLGIQS